MSAEIVTVPAKQVVDTRFTQDLIPILDTTKFEHMQRIAAVMAECAFVPENLRRGDSDKARMASCFLVVNQAVRWNMDAFALAQHSYFVGGKLAYEGKVIAAAVNSDPRLRGRLDYEFDGSGDGRKIVVSGQFRDSNQIKTVEGTTAAWRTKNDQWKSDPDQMLVYRGTRQWARRWMPDRLLGVYAADELEDLALRDVPPGQRSVRMRDVAPPKITAPPDIPDDPVAEPEVTDPPIADEAGYLERLQSLRDQCESIQELQEIAVNEASMIARLTEAGQTAAARILQEE